MQLLGIHASLSGQAGPRATPNSSAGLCLSPLAWTGQSRFHDYLGSSCEDLNQKDLHLSSSLVRLLYSLGSVDKQSCSWHLSTVGMNSVSQDLRHLVIVSPFSITIRFPVAMPLSFSCTLQSGDQSCSFRKATHNTGCHS